MIIRETQLMGVFEVEVEPKADERGIFARTWCQQEFSAHGLNTKLVQCSVSFNTHKGTFRGMHFQEAPHAETKLVRCTQGAIYDLVLDLRPHSSTFRNWIGISLTAERRNAVYIPEGCAHGFLTLADGSEVFYQMTEFYYADSARGVRWNDPAFGIVLPAEIKVISERDRTYPNVEQALG